METILDEIYLHLAYNGSEFRPPYNMRSKPLQRTIGEFHPSTVGAVMTFWESTHNLFEIFCSMDSTTLRSIPVIVYIGMFYGVVILTKLPSYMHKHTSKQCRSPPGPYQPKDDYIFPQTSRLVRKRCRTRTIQRSENFPLDFGQACCMAQPTKIPIRQLRQLRGAS